MKRLNVKTLLDAEYSISTFEILKWLWPVSKGIRGKTIANIAIGVAEVGLDFLFIGVTKLTIDIATGKENSSLNLALAILVGVILIQVLLSFSRSWVNALLGVRSTNKMQIKTFSRILDSVWNGKDQMHSGDTMNRLITDSGSVVSMINDTFPAIVVTLVRLVGAVIFVYLMSPMIAVLLVCIVPIFLSLSKLYIGKMRTKNRDVRDAESRVQSIMQESIQNRVVIKTLEQCGGMVSKLARTQADLKVKVVDKTRFSSLSNMILNFGVAMGYCVTFIWGVKNLQSGAITYGMMLAFIQLVGQVQGPFKALAGYIPALVGAFTSAERLIELEKLPVDEAGDAVRLEGSIGIKVSGLYFSYEQDGKNVIAGLDYDFKPGTMTAIVGETGCGKTTLVRMMLALLSPTCGKMEIYSENGGRSERISPLTRCNIVFVPQGNTLLSGTVRDNLLLGNPEAGDDELKDVLKIACADFVFQKPEGLDFHCGEKGGGLSEGQAQRIAIARALLRPGRILILDEATSALDKSTEEKLVSNILKFSREKQKTVIAVTHRLAILGECNDILDFDNRRTYETI